MVRGVGVVLVVIGVIAMGAALMPWYSCAGDYPANIETIAQMAHIVSVPDHPGQGGWSEASAICWEAYPVSGQRGSLLLGLGGLLLGILAFFFGGVSNELVARRDDNVLPDHLRSELRHHQKPIEEKKSEMSDKEKEVGIEIDDDELAIALGRNTELAQFRKDEVEHEDNLMDQMREQLVELERIKEEEKQGAGTVDGFYCPDDYSSLRVIYVDANSELASDDLEPGRGESVDAPFTTIASALQMAKHKVRSTGQPVQVRVLPGVYQEAVTIPAKVALVNHRMPSEGSNADRLRWLLDQKEVDHPDRVTLLAPTTATEAVGFDPGMSQGIFGMYLVARDGIKQAGVLAKRIQSVRVVNCVIEGFGHGGAQIEYCGQDLITGGAYFFGCYFRRNKASRGGAICARESVLHIDDCLFAENHANRGGAIFADYLRAPLMISRSRFNNNRAQTKDISEDPLLEVHTSRWYEQQGIGGAIWLGRSQMKVSESKFRKNGASVAGGAFAMIGSRAILQGDEDSPILFEACRARSGGAVVLAADQGSNSTFRSEHVEFDRCVSKQGGGALLGVGGVVALFDHTKVEYCEADELVGVGGGVLMINGAEFLGSSISFRANKAGIGGALAIRNASVRLKEQCLFQDNESVMGSGAGMFVDTQFDEQIDEAVAAEGLELPFVMKILEAEFVGNIAAVSPSALAVGDFDGDSAFSLLIEFGDGVVFRSNRIPSRHPDEPNDQLAIMWNERQFGGGGRISAGKMHLS